MTSQYSQSPLVLGSATTKAADNYQSQIERGNQRIDPKSLPTNFFYVSISAVIESAECESEDYLQCKWDMVTGNDWEKVEGQTSGMTQSATSLNAMNKKMVWNYPVDLTYRSLNPFGWPQLVVSVTGPDFFGRSVVRGYGSVHVPTSPGTHTRTIYLYKPLPMSLFTGLMGYLQGRVAEYETPKKLIAKGEGREVTRVETVGKITVKFNISEKNMKKFGYI